MVTGRTLTKVRSNDPGNSRAITRQRNPNPGREIRNALAKPLKLFARELGAGLDESDCSKYGSRSCSYRFLLPGRCEHVRGLRSDPDVFKLAGDKPAGKPRGVRDEPEMGIEMPQPGHGLSMRTPLMSRITHAPH